MIRSVADFIRYFEGVRRRTWVAVDQLTPAVVGWRPRLDEWSCGAIVRHLAGAERFFVARVVDDRWTEDLDPGPERDLAETRALLADGHAPAMARLATVPDARLEEPIRGLEGQTMRLWRFLMAMVEHEVWSPGRAGAPRESARMAGAWRTTSSSWGSWGPGSRRWGGSSPAVSAGASSRPTT